MATPTEGLIRQRVRALARALPAAQEGAPAAVHRARVATRRLRELLPLVHPGSRGRRLRRKVRRLTRALGPVRELDVALETLGGLAGEAPRAAVARLKQVLRQERRRLHDAMAREVQRVDFDTLRRQAIHAARSQRRLDAAARAARRAVRLRSAIESAGSIYLPDRLHEVRIAVKKLRYALELVRHVEGSRAVARLRRLKEAQDLLGRMHDLDVLVARVRALQGSANAPTLRLSSDLDRLVRRLETECRQLHGHYMARRRALLAICMHAAAAPARRGRGKARLSPAA
ncbi:MAG: CHAD domain-containing protein [Acidobacteria bacterium]|nr:CHAD domain-containing protein [Acidobacteriota bacterium]